MKTQLSKRSSYVMPVILVILVVALAVWLTPSWAQKKDNSEQPAKVKKVIVVDEYGNQTEYDDLDKFPSSVKATTDLAITSAGSVMKLADDVLRAIDVPGITREVTRTLSEVRVSDIASSIDTALGEVNWNAINLEVTRAMNDIRSELTDPRIKEDVKISLRAAQSDLAEASASIGTDMAQARRKLRDARLNLAKAGEAEAVDRNMDENIDMMLGRMEEEGLIDRRDGFEVSMQQGRLYINGEEQSRSVYDAYQEYLGKRDFIIEGIEDDITIRLKH